MIDRVDVAVAVAAECLLSLLFMRVEIVPVFAKIMFFLCLPLSIAAFN